MNLVEYFEHHMNPKADVRKARQPGFFITVLVTVFGLAILAAVAAYFVLDRYEWFELREQVISFVSAKAGWIAAAFGTLGLVDLLRSLRRSH